MVKLQEEYHGNQLLILNEGGLGLRDLAQWNTTCEIKLIRYIQEVVEGNINNFGIINTKRKNSWLANELLLLRDNGIGYQLVMEKTTTFGQRTGLH